jgi:hypothetical protein
MAAPSERPIVFVVDDDALARDAIADPRSFAQHEQGEIDGSATPRSGVDPHTEVHGRTNARPGLRCELRRVQEGAAMCLACLHGDRRRPSGAVLAEPFHVRILRPQGFLAAHR